MILSAIAFCKRATCPSSETLLNYKTQGLAVEQSLWVQTHLDECDFCGAEVQLLTEHVPLEEAYALADMPSSLRHLAQSLLTADCLHIESFGETALEKERLTLTDA